VINLLFTCIFASGFFQAPELLPKPGDTVLFLGDSNTFSGHFIANLDLYLTLKNKPNITLINLGLPSETISGLSEKDHPYPRPNVYERLDRALNTIKPNYVIAGYGMNDGIYSPFDSSRFNNYQEGYTNLIKKCNAINARVMLLTPDPFEPLPVKSKLLPLGKPDYSYKNPYEDYDSVLEKYSKWLKTLETKSMPVADAHTAIRLFLSKQRETQKPPTYIFSGDGIHPNISGHWLVTHEILKGWNAPALNNIEVQATSIPLNINLTGKLPFVADPRWDKPITEHFSTSFGKQLLIVNGLKEVKYKLVSAKKELGVFTKQDFELGIDLTRFKTLESNLIAQEIRNLCAERTRVLGNAWLDSIGHKRPDTPKGKPLVEAQKTYEEITDKIKKLLATNLEITLESAN